jgi:hypothetical protein
MQRCRAAATQTRHPVLSLLSHCCHTAVTLLSHRCHTAVTPLSHRCHTAVTLLSHCCHTALTLLLLRRQHVQIPEHTWGLDVKTHLADFVNYTNAPFHACLAAGCRNYGLLLHSWRRQAAYVPWALQALGAQHRIVKQVRGCTGGCGGLAVVGWQGCREAGWVMRCRR